MANIESRWTIQGVAQLITLLATLFGLLVLAYNSGQAWGDVNSRLSSLEQKADQASTDSRTLIELRTDVAYIKRMIMSGAVSVSSNISCPDSQPVLVASYCRSAPTSGGFE